MRLWNCGIRFDDAFALFDAQLLPPEDLFQIRNFLCGAVFGCKPGDMGFDDFPDEEDVPDIILRIEEGCRERLDQRLFARREDVRAVSLPALQKLHRLQGADGFPDGGTGYLEDFGQFPFRGELIALLQFSSLR